MLCWSWKIVGQCHQWCLKNTILRASSRNVKDAADAGKEDKKSLSVHLCRKILENHYKLKKRNRKKKEGYNVSKMKFHVRKIDQKMNESKYNTISFDKNEGVTFNDMYHFCCCRKLGVGVVACRRVPCYCVSCNEMLQKEWKDGGVANEDQPRFQHVENCYFNLILGYENRWYFKTITERTDSVKEDGDEGRHDVLQNIAADMALQIKVGQYGAQSTSIENARHGYYLCKFLETPYTCQESGRLMCKIWWW